LPLAGGLCGRVSRGCEAMVDRESEDLLFGRLCMSSGIELEEATDQRVFVELVLDGGGPDLPALSYEPCEPYELDLRCFELELLLLR
jgi:hypothetical protein